MIRSLNIHDVLLIVAATRWTLLLAILVFAGAVAVGLPVAVMRISRTPILRWLAIAYVHVVQGTPLLVWLFLLFFGISALGMNVNAWASVTVAFAVYGGAFLGEAWYGAFRSVPQSQWDAAASLGLSRAQQFHRVILPQSLRIATPPTVGIAVQLLKNTSLASTIGVYELTQSGVLISGATFRPLPVFGVVGLFYFLLCYPLTRWSRALERRLSIPHRVT